MIENPDRFEMLRDALDQKGCAPTWGDDRFRAICPACGNSNRTKLLVTRGRKLPVLVTCFAGCDWRDVLMALGLSANFAMPPSADAFNKPQRWILSEPETHSFALASLRSAQAWIDGLRGGARASSVHGTLALASEMIRSEAKIMNVAGRMIDVPKRTPAQARLVAPGSGEDHGSYLLALQRTRDAHRLLSAEFAIADAQEATMRLRAGLSAFDPSEYHRRCSRLVKKIAESYGL